MSTHAQANNIRNELSIKIKLYTYNYRIPELCTLSGVMKQERQSTKGQCNKQQSEKSRSHLIRRQMKRSFYCSFQLVPFPWDRCHIPNTSMRHRHFPYFTEPEGLLPRSQKPATSSYPEFHSMIITPRHHDIA